MTSSIFPVRKRCRNLRENRPPLKNSNFVFRVESFIQIPFSVNYLLQKPIKVNNFIVNLQLF